MNDSYRYSASGPVGPNSGDTYSYAIPATAIDPPITVRPLLKLETPPPSTPGPELASAPATVVTFTEHFGRSKHVINAAFPRTHSSSTDALNYPQGGPDESKEARTNRFTGIGAALLAKKKAIERGETLPNPQDSPVLLMEVERFAPTKQRDSKGRGLTLVFAHASGFHKEIWHVVIEQLLSNQVERSDTLYIDEIWTLDAANHGGSALLNKDKLGDVFDWSDNARDVVNFLACYLPSHAQPASALPLYLPRLTGKELESRLSRGHPTRTVIGIGHSLGGCAMARAAEEYRSLVSALILVDPVIVPPGYEAPFSHKNYIYGAISRRTHWETRAQAHQLFRTSPFFAAWDPRVLKCYVEHGLIEHSEGVSLKTPSFQEAVTFCELQTCQETWALLNRLDPRIAVHWIMPGKPPTVTGGERSTAQTVWRRRTNSTNVRIRGAGHLVAHEKPSLLADRIWTFISNYYAGGQCDARQASLQPATL